LDFTFGRRGIVMRPGAVSARGRDSLSATIVKRNDDERIDGVEEMSDVVAIRPRALPRVSARDAAALTRAARLLAELSASARDSAG